MKRNSLIIVYHDLGIGGVQRKIVDIVNMMGQSHKYRGTPIYIVLAIRKPFELIGQITNPAVSIRYAPSARQKLFFLFLFFSSLWRRPTHILAFLPYFAVPAFVVKRLLFWKHIRVIVSIDVVFTDSFKRGDFSKTIRDRFSRLFPAAARIIVPTNHIKRDLVNDLSVSPSTISILSNWTIIKPTRARKKITDCIYIGRLSPEKNLSVLIDAVAHMKKDKPDISLWLVGDGEEKNRLLALCDKHRLKENIRFLSPTADIAPLLASAKCAVLTSTSEGMPIFALEAMASGLPLVAMKCTGVEELFDHNSIGFLCQTKNEFVQHVLTLCNNVHFRKQLGTNAMQAVAKAYGRNALMQFIEKIME